MSFDAINESIRTGGGSFVQLNKVENPPLEGFILNVEEKDKMYEGRVVPNKNGDPRKEWLFTLDVGGETKKWAAGESAQIAIKNLMAKQAGPDGRPMKIEKGGKLRVEVTKDSVSKGPNKAQAEVLVSYIPPKFTAPQAEEELPF